VVECYVAGSYIDARCHIVMVACVMRISEHRSGGVCCHMSSGRTTICKHKKYSMKTLVSIAHIVTKYECSMNLKIEWCVGS
jgi:hypothetical protein